MSFKISFVSVIKGLLILNPEISYNEISQPYEDLVNDKLYNH